MLYTTTSSDHQLDRIRLFPSPEAAVKANGTENRAVHGVAVRLDRGAHRVIPLWTNAQVFDPAWLTPAELLADRSIIARGPIPSPLFVHDLDVLAEAMRQSFRHPRDITEAGVKGGPPALRNDSAGLPAIIPGGSRVVARAQTLAGFPGGDSAWLEFSHAGSYIIARGIDDPKVNRQSAQVWPSGLQL